MAPPDWKSAIEIHPAGWVCPAEPFWVAGWAASPQLDPIDVRAWLGSTPFLGLCGLPRPDKETEVRGQPGPPRAGFSFLLQPVAGAEEVRIEICDQHGRWTEIFRRPVTVPANAAPSAVRCKPDARSLLRLLRAKHTRPGEAWSTLAREVLVAETAESFDVMPSFPFQGALEEMAAQTAVQYDQLLVTGWVSHREQRIVALTALLDTRTPLPLVHGLDRADAGTLFPDLIDGARSRFAGLLPIPLAAPQPLALRIFATLENGRQELVFLKRFRPVLVSGRGTDLPSFSAGKFARAAWALHRSARSPVIPDQDFRRELHAAWQAYRHAAPVMGALPPARTDSPSASPRPLCVTLVTHNLNFEGAPLFLLEYARYLATQPGWQVRVISPQDGPLREAFTKAGATVELIEAEALPSARTDEAFTATLQKLAATPGWNKTDVIVANTLVAFWAVHLAQLLRKPALFYVHESVSARRFFALQLKPEAIGRVERAFALATRVVFIADAARRAHTRLEHKGNFRILPGWINVARIRDYAAHHDRAAQRRELGLPAEAVVFAHIGSLLPHKGQHVFLAAIARLLPKLAGGPPPVFLLVGAKTGIDPYADLLRHTLAHLTGADIRLVAQSTDAYRFFQAADIFVCSSLEEALPRVVMEAAAFGRLIVSTDVDGIPELLTPRDAWLVPPENADRLADAMEAACIARRNGDFSRAERAREAVSRFDAAVLLPQHADLIRTVAAITPH